MNIDAAIIDGPVRPPEHPGSVVEAAGAAGAVLEFLGVVRESEGGRSILALDYQVYEPMASHQLEAIAGDLCRTLGLLACSIRHSRGRVPVGAASLWVRVCAPHRAEAIEGLRRLLDRLKADVPIWKSPVFA